MADHGGDGNIKVVVRCRPLNSRGPSHPHIFKPLVEPHLALCIPAMNSEQNSREARSPSSACKATKPSSTLPSPALNKKKPQARARRNARRWRSASISRIGARGRGTSRAIVRSRRCLMIWGRSCWIMALRGSIRVSWLVRVLFLYFGRVFGEGWTRRKEIVC